MFIRTPRLFLRPAWREDVLHLSRLLADSDVQRDLSGTPFLEIMADCDELLQPQRAPADVRLLIFQRTEETPRLIGAAGIGQPQGRHDFGLWLDPRHRRHGYALEAGKAVVELAFDGLRIDSLWCPALRQGSAARLVSRLGFRTSPQQQTLAVLEADCWSAPSTPMAA